jgi:hypothetical protein
MFQRKKLLLSISLLSICFCLFIILAWVVPNISGIASVEKYFYNKLPVHSNKIKGFISKHDREVKDIGKRRKLPLMHLYLSRKDIAHFYELRRKYEIGDHFYYLNNNKWRKALLEYNGIQYKIKIKALGKDPANSHKQGKFISYSIKLNGNEQIYNANRFNLVIRERLKFWSKIYLDLAKRFGLIAQKLKPIRIAINEWEEKVFYFEYRLNEKYMESINKESLKILGHPNAFFYNLMNESGSINKSALVADRSLIVGAEPLYLRNGAYSHPLYPPFSEEKYFNKFGIAFKKSSFPSIYKQEIYEYYLMFNQSLVNGNYRNAIKYLDFNYMTSFVAAVAIGGFSEHMFTVGNLYVFLDIANGKFYPLFVRDANAGLLSIKPRETLGQSIPHNAYLHTDKDKYSFDLFHAVFRSDYYRQEIYKKLYQFIKESGDATIDQHYKLWVSTAKMHYFGWIKIVLDRLGVQKYKDFTGRNIRTIKQYLEKSSPEVAISPISNGLIIEIRPKSMSALQFDKLVLKELPSSLLHAEKVRIKLITTSLDNIEKVEEAQSHITNKSNEIHLTDSVSNFQFFSALSRYSEKVPRKYYLIVEFEDIDRLALSKANVDLSLINAVTAMKISSKDVTIYDGERIFDKYHSLLTTKDDSFIDWEGEHKFLNVSLTQENELVIHPGVYKIHEDLIIPNKLKLIIEAGTTLLLAEDKALVAYNGLEVRGTAEKPVIITSIYPDKPFGTIGILGDEKTSSDIRYLHLSNGSERWIGGVYFSGGISFHYNNSVEIFNSTISGNKADDGLNIKHSNVLITDSTFMDNSADQVDLDYCTGSAINSTFYFSNIDDNNGDGLDISGSSILVKDSRFNGFRDKGLSVGEKSKTALFNNAFYNNNMGAAIKDLSHAYFIGNTFNNNEKDINVYQKKAIFGGGRIYLVPENKRGYKIEYSLDKKSSIRYFPGVTIPIRLESIKNGEDVQNMFKTMGEIKFQ